MEKRELKDYDQGEPTSIASMGENLAYGERHCSVIAVDPISPEGSRDIISGEATRRYYWVGGNLAKGSLNEFLCVYGMPEEYLGFPGDAIATTSVLSKPWEEAEPDPNVWRGVFCPNYNRRILFTEEVILKTAELPRLQPKITIDRRTLERENE